MADGMLSLSWNNHRATFCHILATLRDKERYTDVTVACEGKFYPVHKLVLSTCSEYFEKIFENTPCKHPVIVLKDVNRSDLEALFCYMYEGAVSVAQSNLGRLIKAAEVLRIKGLAVPDEPPISDGGVRRGASSHHHHSSDDRSSPHPKRRRREESNSHTHLRTRSSPSPPSSPRPSPLHDREDSHPALRSRSDSQWGDQGANERDDGGVDGLGEDRMGDHSAASHTAPTPPQVEVMMDETLVKEEMIDQEDTGQEDLMDSGMDYASVGSDSRLDGSATGGGGEEDHILPGKYEPKANPGHQAIPEAVVEALAGPSGMQTWLGGGEMPSGFSGLEGYAGAEGTQDLHAPSQAPAAHQLVELGSNCHWSEAAQSPPEEWPALGSGGGGGGGGVVGSSSSKVHQCPYCTYSTTYIHTLRRHTLKHTGEKPFACPHCSYCTTRNALLKEHINTHTGARPFSCSFCSYSSSHKNILKRHIRTHTGEKPYTCGICSYQAASKTNLNSHLLTHEPGRDPPT
ncbi:protein bric-a-brac 1-like isoform X3 [Eriocheir sinensis]|uniref:protein bric-a-brac 1-like isoform X3 n=1 Tax=Eriocheir sinensis TaxID=95602 RepID=UPI0021C7822D|nr:protein bric-a-brac 1-like isoform X3 [Eriocheir sinensis]